MIFQRPHPISRGCQKCIHDIIIEGILVEGNTKTCSYALMNQDERRLGHNSWETGQEEVCDLIIEMVQMLPPPQAFLIAN